jgi:hypothetical protein
MTYVCTILKPVDETRLVVPDHVAIIGHRPVRCALVHDQLHRFDTAVEVGVEIPGNGGIGNLIMLMVRLVLSIPDENCVLEDTSLGEELLDEVVPVLQVISALRSL